MLGPRWHVDYTETMMWERSMQLVERTVLLSRCLPAEERFGMRSQMSRCATSVPSNIAEGWVRESWREKVRFLSIAHGSLAELHTQLLICVRVGWLSCEDVAPALQLADDVARMLTRLKRVWRARSGDPRATIT
jgi:four helix bundle protein